MENILNKKVNVLEEILPMLKNKNINDLIDLLKNDLKIGNKPLNILKKCNYCGKLFKTNMARFNDIMYCDMDCRNEYKRKFPKKGKDNPSYNSIERFCSNCNKKIMVEKVASEKVNSFGENNKFCSQKCYWEYRSKHYIKEKHPCYGKVYTDEQIENFRKNTIKMIRNGKFPQTLTKPHIKINKLLEDMNIKYINEFSCKYHSIDIYLEDYNLMIEIMGDYWHGSPLKYKKENLSKIQLKSIKQDKSKHSYVKKYYNIEILYLWEKDINERIDLCEKILKEYLNNNLKNYQSFNYDNLGKLKRKILNPFFITTKNP